MQVSFFWPQALGASLTAAKHVRAFALAVMDILDLPQDPGSGPQGVLEHFQVWQNASADLRRPNFTILAS